MLIFFQYHQIIKSYVILVLSFFQSHLSIKSYGIPVRIFFNLARLIHSVTYTSRAPRATKNSALRAWNVAVVIVVVPVLVRTVLTEESRRQRVYSLYLLRATESIDCERGLLQSPSQQSRESDFLE